MNVNSSREKKSRIKPIIFLILMALAAPSASVRAEPVTLRLAANYWEPYTGKDIPNQGIATEIVLTALERAGYFSRVEFMPWSRVQALAYNRVIDGIVAVWPTAQRQKKLVLSQSYLKNRLYLYHIRSDVCKDGYFAPMPNIKIGVGRDYDYSESFQEKYGKYLSVGDRVQQNLLKLKYGRIDYLLEDDLVMKSALKYVGTEYANTPILRCPKSPLMELELSFALRSDFPNAVNIIQKFDEEIRKMRKDGTINSIFVRHK